MSRATTCFRTGTSAVFRGRSAIGSLAVISIVELILFTASATCFAQADVFADSTESMVADTNGDLEHMKVESPADVFPQPPGPWDRARSDLAEVGVTFDFSLKMDDGTALSNGLRRAGGHLRNMDFSVRGGGEQLFGLPGMSLLIHIMSNNGGSLGDIVGDAQTVSNIEAPRGTKVYQAYLQQNFGGDGLSVLVGLYDLNSDFYVTQNSLLFLNSSFGIGKEISQTGSNGPSIFPNTSAGLRILVHPTQSSYVQTVILDAVPGRTDDPDVPSLTMSSDEGALLVIEGGLVSPAEEHSFKVGLGGWIYTTKVQETGFVNEEVPQRSLDCGAYLLGEHDITRPSGTRSFGLAGFLRAGIARTLLHTFDFHLDGGIVVEGFTTPRICDKAGIGVTYAHRATHVAVTEEGSLAARGECTIEATTQSRLLSWLAVQADIQHVIHPAALLARSSTTVGICRLLIAF